MKAIPSAPPVARRPQRRKPMQRLSLRLPLGLAARLAALCELHKEKSRNQILIDLLTLAVSELEKAAPPLIGIDQVAPEDRNATVYLLNGPFSEFHHLVIKHHLRMERELAGEDVEPPVLPDPYNLNVDEA